MRCRGGDPVAWLRRQGDARLDAVAPRLDAREDAHEQACPDEREAGVDRGGLLSRAVSQGERGGRPGEDGESCEAEGRVACERMVARHPPDEVSRHREPRQNGAERGQSREQEARSSLDPLPDGEEPRHDGRAVNTASPPPSQLELF